MADLSTSYMGLELKNPIIVSSSGWTSNLESVQKCEEAGTAAVVMKSIFEEQILAEVDALASQSLNGHPEMQDYLNNYGKEYSLQNYITEIEKVKKNTSIPVIGSVNCALKGAWTDFVKRIEDTGVDGLELNIFIIPNDIHKTSEDIESSYYEIFSKIKEDISIPVAVKLSPYITTPGHLIKRLHDMGAQTFVLFNRPLPFDIDIENQTVKVGNIVSSTTEMSHSLRMISMIAGYFECELAASTGVLDAESVIKHIFAGADVVQICSALYKNGNQYLATMIKELNDWLDRHSISSIHEIKGKLSYKNSPKPSAYERVQYMKTYSDFI